MTIATTDLPHADVSTDWAGHMLAPIARMPRAGAVLWQDCRGSARPARRLIMEPASAGAEFCDMCRRTFETHGSAFAIVDADGDQTSGCMVCPLCIALPEREARAVLVRALRLVQEELAGRLALTVAGPAAPAAFDAEDAAQLAATLHTLSDVLAFGLEADAAA